MKNDKETPQRLASTILGAIGVVYGDIGTSPLYTMKQVFAGPYPTQLSPESIMGVLSLIFWALTMVISIKYVLFIMRADNRGEGGIMALMALALHRRHRRTHRSWIMAIGLFGTALFYGDGLITPAISVLSAVEGLEIGTPRFHPYIQPISIAVLVLLFSIQKQGTGRVGLLVPGTGLPGLEQPDAESGSAGSPEPRLRGALLCRQWLAGLLHIRGRGARPYRR
jgi:KUP system potassium uptake protein